MDFLSEAFKSLQTLNEETFDISLNGENTELKDFLDQDDEIDTLTIIDDEAETEDELQDSYLNKVILDCNVCHSLIYKDVEDVHIDEDGENANIDEECPFCYSVDGFKIIGQVKPFGEEEEDKEETEVEDEVEVEDGDVETEEDKEIIKTESLDNRKARLREACKARLKAKREACEDGKCGDAKCEAKDAEEVHREERRISRRNRKDAEEITESIENLSLDTEDTHMEMTTEGDEVTIKTKPREEEIEVGDETIAPLDAEVEDEITVDSDEKETEDGEIEVDEFDEEAFESLGESYLKKVYSNVDSFKVSRVSENGADKLFVEGLITFNSGNTKKTNFVFKNNGVTKRGKTVFEGYNKEITRSNKSFRLKGRVEGNKIISESLAYRYNQNKKLVNGIVK